MVPAPLLPALWPDLINGRPDAHIPVRGDQDRMFEPAIPEIPEHREPGFCRLSITGFYRQDLLAAVAHRADH